MAAYVLFRKILEILRKFQIFGKFRKIFRKIPKMIHRVGIFEIRMNFENSTQGRTHKNFWIFVGKYLLKILIFSGPILCIILKLSILTIFGQSKIA